jgi:hypothetical protein
MVDGGGLLGGLAGLLFDSSQGVVVEGGGFILELWNGILGADAEVGLFTIDGPAGDERLED